MTVEASVLGVGGVPVELSFEVDRCPTCHAKCQMR